MLNKFRLLLEFGCMILLLILPFTHVDKTVSMKQVSSVIESYSKTSKYEHEDTKFIRKYYHLNKEDYQSAVIYKHPSTMEAEELSVFYETDENKEKAIYDKLEKRMQDKLQSFKGYGQRQSDLIQKGFIFQKGPFIFLMVDEQAATLKNKIYQLF